MSKYDFSGWATRNNIKCSDGRTIMKNAFLDDHGKTVPLVWQHVHDNPENVLGHAVLENREDGVYCYCSLNDSDNGKIAKEMVKHGDIDHLSIYANHLQQSGGNVNHGEIKEVSLVLAGANPGAVIDNITIAHSDGSLNTADDEAIIYVPDEDVIEHNDKEDKKMAEENTKNTENSKENLDDKTLQDVINTMNEDQKKAMYAIVGLAIEDAKKNKSAEHSDSDDKEDSLEHGYEGSKKQDDKKELEHEDPNAQKTDINQGGAKMAGENKTLKDVIDTMNDDQKNAMYTIVGLAVEDSKKGNVQHSDVEEGEIMNQNVFEGNNGNVTNNTLSHDDIKAIFNDAKSCGSLKEAVLAHTASYGVDNIEYFFPEAKTISNEPDLIKRQDAWVGAFMDGVHKTPFSRIKSLHANITEAEARAKGYVKGTQKLYEVIKALKRVTNPTTVYKIQKLDRDDVLDITDFDMVAYIKAEMRIMLNEEVARACLIGDGRLDSADDKINPENIRPVYGDSDIYTIYKRVTIASGASNKDIVDKVSEAILTGLEDYKGSGNPDAFVEPHLYTQMMLAQDGMGRRLYSNANELASALGVNKIHKAPVFSGTTRTVEVGSETKNYKLYALVLNMKDYNIGTDKGGQVSLFDDFDIDFNQYKYLLETRMSGALIKPYSAIAIEQEVTSSVG